MRILLLHNSYQQEGGEDTVLANESMLLRENNHEVHVHQVSNNRIRGLWDKLVTAWQTPYSPRGKMEATQAIRESHPDIVHVHNFFPLLSPAIYDACREARVPVVQSLHNYRTICPGALLMREGKPCNDCLKGSPYQAVLHACYRDSRLGSLAVARMVNLHRKRGTWKNRVDQFIVMTKFAKEKYVEAGFPKDKITIKPNFVPSVRISKEINREKRNGALFVGRLSPEKGIATLVRCWENLDIPLSLIGSGPLLKLISQKKNKHVTVLGRKTHMEVAEAMARAQFLVMPSTCYEGFPMILIEAFAQGLPVIASRLGAMAEIVDEGETGLLFEPGDPLDLAGKVRWATEHPEEMLRMGRNARQVYEDKYTPEINYRQLMAIYQKAIQNLKTHANAPAS